jgi:kumamolisin
MRRAIAAAVVPLILICAGRAGATSSPNPIAQVPTFIQAAQLLGPADPTRQLHVVIFLGYPNPTAVAQLTTAVNDPSSPEYGSFLTPSQFDSAYAPSPKSYTMVEYVLENAGLKVVQTYANRQVIDAIGTVSQIDALFDTVIDYYAYGNWTYYANSVTALVPAALQGVVIAASGLNNFAEKAGAPVVSGLKAGPFGFGPANIETAYNFPIHHNPSIAGKGATIAIETAYDYLDADVSAFWTQYGIDDAGAVQRLYINDPVNQGLPAPGESQETTFDVEQATSNAPGGNVLVVEASDPLNSTFDDVYEAVVMQPHVDVVSTSWGQCEAASDSDEVMGDNDLFEQGAAEGQTMFAASGDNGSQDCGTNDPPFGLPGEPNPITVDFPGSSPYVAAGGGTTLTLNPHGAIKSETAWSGSGGGISAFFALPFYQVPVPTLGSTTNRNTPDVALDADPAAPYSLFYDGSWASPVGGTSAVAPILAALYAQCDGWNHHRLGLAQTGLYSGFVEDTYPGSAWHDVVSGSNGDYSAHPGYDNVTGVGSLDGMRYMLQIPKTKGHAPL